MTAAVFPDLTSPAHARVLDHAEGRVLVTGPPGSGKTAVLIERFARLVEGGADPERITLVVLNRRAALQARELIVRRVARSLPALGVHTAHSFAFRVLGSRYGELDYAEPPQVLSAAEQYAVVRELLANDDASKWPALGHLLRVPGFAREVADFVLRAQERLLAPDDVRAMAERAERPEYKEVARFYGEYLDATGSANQVDFAGLLNQAAAALQRGPSDDDRTDHLMVDDYQDLTDAAEAMIVAMATPAVSVVVAADPGGHVFSYRGGSVEPLERVSRTLGPAGHVTLDHTDRIAPDALAALDDPDAPAAAVPGSVEARCYVHPGEEADAIAQELLRARVDDDIPWERMAVVLRRYGEYLTALRHALLRHGIPFVVVEEASAIAAEPANRPIIELLRYALHPERRDEMLEPILSSPIVGLDPHALRRVRREARLRGIPMTELVRDAPLDGIPDDLRAPLERFRVITVSLAERVRRDRPDEVFFWLWSNLPYARALVDGERHRDLDALSALGDILGRFAERRPGARVVDYLETLDAAEFGPDPWVLPEERRPHAVRVISAHRAHGMEFDLVCVAGCVEGEFPAPLRANPLVDLEHLIAPKSPAERLRLALAEERRLFRLAVSRGRGRTILFASSSPSSAKPRTPSRYIARLGIAAEAANGGGVATSLRSLEADLRRTLADGTRPAAERLGALAALPLTGATPGEWWGTREWTDSDRALYDDVIRTSYSRLSNMNNCALQYLYQVEMGLDPEQSFQMWLGSVIHSIIDRVQRGEIPREEERVLAALEEVWRPELFPNAAIEHRRHIDARDMLTRWIAHEHAEPLRSEVAFEFPIGEAILRGKIDAVFPMNRRGRLRVVDYKTGRGYPTEEEVKEDLQLAAYYLAVKRTPELAELGEPSYLQLAYIGVPNSREGFKRLAVSPAQREDYEGWAEETITGLVGEIRAERFAPDPEADCRWCRFRSICPMWPEGGEAVR